MQASAVWMPVLGHGPGLARAASPPEPGSQETAYACEREHARGRRKADQPINNQLRLYAGACIQREQQTTEAACN